MDQSAKDAQPDRHSGGGAEEERVDPDQKRRKKGGSLVGVPYLCDQFIAGEGPAGHYYGISFIHLITYKNTFHGGEKTADEQQYTEYIPFFLFCGFLIHGALSSAVLSVAFSPIIA